MISFEYYRPVLAAFALQLLLLPGPLWASDDTGFININAGYIGLMNRAHDTLRYGLEYRHKPLTHWLIRPAVGGVTAEHDARYVYAGIRRDFPLGSRWIFTPGFDITSYRRGNGIDLGSELEFRTGLELSWRFSNAWRASFVFYHLSNGGIGDRNPGTNSAVIAVQVPVDWTGGGNEGG